MDENKKCNINKKAVAIEYKKSFAAPKVIASGEGHFAETMINKAKAYNVPTYEDKELVEELLKINLGDNIPEDLYRAVAQVLIFITNIDKGLGTKKYE